MGLFKKDSPTAYSSTGLYQTMVQRNYDGKMSEDEIRHILSVCISQIKTLFADSLGLSSTEKDILQGADVNAEENLIRKYEKKSKKHIEAYYWLLTAFCKYRQQNYETACSALSIAFPIEANLKNFPNGRGDFKRAWAALAFLMDFETLYNNSSTARSLGVSFKAVSQQVKKTDD